MQSPPRSRISTESSPSWKVLLKALHGFRSNANLAAVRLMIPVADICELNLTELSKLLATRELSSSETVKATLARLERLEGKLNAFITVTGEQAIAEAKK